MPHLPFASALSPLAVLNALAAAAPVQRERGLAYGIGPRRSIDVYRPRDAEGAPLAVFFYGGGWEEGDRAMYRFAASALAASGIVTMVPDYRVFPEVTFPGFLEDGALATRWALENAARFGADPDKLVLIGHSAGAYIAAMLALDSSFLEAVGVSTARIRGWVGLGGPYDFTPDTPNRRTIFAPAGTHERSQPITHARAGAPPALLASGAEDVVVDPGNSVRLARAMRKYQVRAEVRIYPRTSHETILGAFSPLVRFMAPSLADTVGFVNDVTSAHAVRQAA